MSGRAGQSVWSTWWIAWSFFAGAFALVLYLGAASQASRFFVEAQRSGLIELLLATPLTAKQILEGQWRALLRMFGLPLVVWIALQLLGTFLAQQTWSRLAATAPADSTVGRPFPIELRVNARHVKVQVLTFDSDWIRIDRPSAGPVLVTPTRRGVLTRVVEFR